MSMARGNHEAGWRKVCGATCGVSLDCKSHFPSTPMALPAMANALFVPRCCAGPCQIVGPCPQTIQAPNPRHSWGPSFSGLRSSSVSQMHFLGAFNHLLIHASFHHWVCTYTLSFYCDLRFAGSPVQLDMSSVKQFNTAQLRLKCVAIDLK